MTAHFLENAQNLVISNSCFVDNSMTFQNTQDGAGLRVLLEASVPEAAHDSAARYPPPRCHPETRKGFIQEILSWAQPDPNQNVFKPRLLWLNGPAGVGKSAIAQTTAELLGERLGAAFFFSRLNHRDDANRLLPSIAYQLATSHAPYRKAIDTLLHNDPTLVSKSIRRQFQSLIIIPSQLEVQRDSLREKVIIIDGLDECQGNDYQRDIIDVIAASIRDQSTPFIWAIMSRPEPHLVASFTSLSLKRFCRNMEVTVSRDNDDEMRQYLGDGLGEIQHLQGISAASEPWFTEEDLEKLIDLAAGLFIYAATVLRFINQPSPLGPEGQLRIVLALHERYQTSPLARSKSKHPLSELDLFYMLIMQRIPTKVLPVTMKILLAVAYYPRYRDVPSALKIADILGLSEPQFTNALCQNLQSVLTLVVIQPRGSAPELVIRFYHASFMDFLQDGSRSGLFSLNHAVTPLRQDIFRWLNNRNQSFQAAREIDHDPAQPDADSELYRSAFRCLLRLCISLPVESSDILTLENLRTFDYATACTQGEWYGLDISTFLENLPKAYRRKIIRPFWSLWNTLTKSGDQVYELGSGKNKALAKAHPDKKSFRLQPFPRTITERWSNSSLFSL